MTVRSTQAARIAAAAVVFGCWVPTTIASADPSPPPGPAPGPAPAPAAITTSIDQDGTYSVGTDIATGTYSSAGPVDDGACYWKRLSGDTVVDNALSKKPQVVRIEATDTSFKTSRCQPWQKIDDCLPGCGPAPIGPGDLLGQLGRLILQHPGGPPAPGS